jgi:uncharacterized protein YkwD
MRRLTAAVSALAFMGVVAGAAAPVSADHPTPGAERTELTERPAAKVKAHVRYQRQAHKATNKHRAADGLKELRRTDCVQRFAVRQAKAMAQREARFHQELAPILEACDLRAVGENVAEGYLTGHSVVNNGWMNSPGHRANILNPTYRLMGIGARKGADGRWYVSQVFGRGS